MNTIKKFFLNILILLIIVLLCGCQSEDSKIFAVSEKNLESGLESDLQNGYLNYYKILKAELYAPSAEDADNPDLVELPIHILFMRCALEAIQEKPG